MRGQQQAADELSSPACELTTQQMDLLDRVEQRLFAIEVRLSALLEQRVPQEYYSTSDAARLLGKAEFTIREWCRLGRVHAKKRLVGRGNAKEWIISHEELDRIKSHGLLPIRR